MIFLFRNFFFFVKQTPVASAHCDSGLLSYGPQLDPFPRPAVALGHQEAQTGSDSKKSDK